MLEALVSSRIRRALFGYILSHPQERFYLRGLAKALDLSISPLRRELKRLESVGMLRTTKEANVLFYTVDAQSQAFRELQRLGVTNGPAATRDEPVTPEPATLEPKPQPQPMPQGPWLSDMMVRPQQHPSAWPGGLLRPALIRAAGVALPALLLLVGIMHLSPRHQPSGRVLTTQRAELVRTTPEPSTMVTARGETAQVPAMPFEVIGVELEAKEGAVTFEWDGRVMQWEDVVANSNQDYY